MELRLAITVITSSCKEVSQICHQICNVLRPRSSVIHIKGVLNSLCSLRFIELGDESCINVIFVFVCLFVCLLVLLIDFVFDHHSICLLLFAG